MKENDYFGVFENTNGWKARTDIQQILSRFNYRFLEFSKNRIGLSLIFSLKMLIFGMGELRKKHRLIFQFPPFSEELPLIWCSIFFGLKPIALIHDLDDLRGIRNRALSVIGDYGGYKLLRNSIVVSHNESMSRHLESKNIKIALEIGVFDYLTPTSKLTQTERLNHTHRPPIIIFAGNLDNAKSSFVEQALNIVDRFEIYGKTQNLAILNSRSYKGEFESSVPPKIDTRAFGLIWDGSSVHDLVGNFGSYLKFNSPHKLSLYLAMGIPVITQRDSAISELVEQLQIGFSIESISDVNGLDLDEKWEKLIPNVLEFQSLVTSGAIMTQCLALLEQTEYTQDPAIKKSVLNHINRKRDLY